MHEFVYFVSLIFVCLKPSEYRASKNLFGTLYSLHYKKLEEHLLRIFLFTILSVHSFERFDGPPPAGPWSPDTVRPPILFTARNRCPPPATDSSLCLWMRLIWSAARAESTSSLYLRGLNVWPIQRWVILVLIPINDSRSLTILVFLRKYLIKKHAILIAFTFFGSLLTNDEVISDYNRTDITNNLNLAKGTVCLPRF